MKSALILIFLLFITGCGGSQKEFTVWIGGAPGEIEFWEELVEEFRKSTGINTVTVRQPTYSQQRIQSLVISLKARQPDPDIYLMDIVWINQFVSSGWLEPLNRYMERDSYNEDIFFERLVKESDIFSGSFYALPVFADAGMLYYRKDLLEKYGYAVPETWDELAAAAEYIMEREGISGYVWQGAQYEGLVCSFIEFIKSNGGGIWEGKNSAVLTSENKEALKFMRRLIESGISPQNTYTEMKEEEARRAFQRGGALFERNWSYAFALHESEDSPVKGKTGIAKLPAFEGGETAAVLGGWHAGISSYSDSKDEAWEFMKFITSYDVQKRMLTEVGWNPARTDIYEDAELKQNYPHLEALKETLENAVNRPALPYYMQLSEILQRQVNSCIAGNISAETALRNIEKEMGELRGYYYAEK